MSVKILRHPGYIGRPHVGYMDVVSFAHKCFQASNIFSKSVSYQVRTVHYVTVERSYWSDCIRVQLFPEMTLWRLSEGERKQQACCPTDLVHINGLHLNQPRGCLHTRL